MFRERPVATWVPAVVRGDELSAPCSSCPPSTHSRTSSSAWSQRGGAPPTDREERVDCCVVSKEFGVWLRRSDASREGSRRNQADDENVLGLKQKLIEPRGKKCLSNIQYRAGQEEKHTSHQFVDRNLAKKMNVNAWDFELMKVDKVVGHTHRLVSADGKTPTVIKSGTQTGGQTGDGSKFLSNIRRCLNPYQGSIPPWRRKQHVGASINAVSGSI